MFAMLFRRRTIISFHVAVESITIIFHFSTQTESFFKAIYHANLRSPALHSACTIYNIIAPRARTSGELKGRRPFTAIHYLLLLKRTLKKKSNGTMPIFTNRLSICVKATQLLSRRRLFST